VLGSSVVIIVVGIGVRVVIIGEFIILITVLECIH